MNTPITGIIPVVLTPFTPDDRIDWDGYAALIEWYLANGAQALFAVCQSSEMQFLSLQERLDLARFTAKAVAGRVPVVASGHISESLDDQRAELKAMADTGVDGVVLVTNRLAPANAPETALRTHLDALLSSLPEDMPLGLYECPAPYRRLLTDDEIEYCAQSGRFALIKDVSCDLDTVKRRIALTQSTPLRINNANAAIAWPALQAGASGFCGVMLNVHPDLYRWLQDHGAKHPDLTEELATFLVLSAMCEPMGYPKLAKVFHQRLGTFAHTDSRTITFDIHQRFWALDDIIARIEWGNAHFRSRIKALGTPA
ncbi:4-hydroxy-tetrahydrodipicolinate synthase [Marinobacterium lacunae]|uniref:4-hydroxy-tetrahydrodipicolinate synthase n=1 Tax=Marinobacterium lacunae TaxID=1232683 RepID=A0A081FUS9_9GAMM|nr:dihydrodipicolinate synthase family protein [Marinobacterium lacunae]KEA62284.1 4-hydroxy-tetrahydrodipicolinate synthase [Marinobacterium lacunae]